MTKPAVSIRIDDHKAMLAAATSKTQSRLAHLANERSLRMTAKYADLKTMIDDDDLLTQAVDELTREGALDAIVAERAAKIATVRAFGQLQIQVTDDEWKVVNDCTADDFMRAAERDRRGSACD